MYDIAFDATGEIEYQLIRNNEGSKDLYDIYKAKFYNDTVIMTNRYNGKTQF